MDDLVLLVAFVGLALFILALAGFLADAIEDAERRDARRRNHGRHW